MKRRSFLFASLFLAGSVCAAPAAGTVGKAEDAPKAAPLPAAEEILSWPGASQNTLVYSTGFENPAAREIIFLDAKKAEYAKGAGNTGNTALHLKGQNVLVRINLPRSKFKQGAKYTVKVFVRGNIRTSDGRKIHGHGSYRFIETRFRDLKTGKELHWSHGVFPFTPPPHDPDSITEFKEFSYEFSVKEGTFPYLYFTTCHGPFEGDLWFDDLRIYQCGKDSHVNLAKPMMKAFPHGNGRVEFYAVSAGVARPILLAEFRKEGKTIRSLIMRPEKDGLFRGDFGSDLPAGIGEIRASFASEDEKLLLKSEVFPVSVLAPDAVPPRGAVSFDGKNRIMVDGKPFFGLSLGCIAPVDAEHLKRHAEAGFNVIDTGPFNLVPWNEADHGRKLLRKLDELQKLGLKIRLNLIHFYSAPQMGLQYGNGVEGAVKLVTMVRNHPAILGYYILDELTEKDWPVVRKFHEAINLADPWHPCFICTNLRGTLPKISVTGDVIGYDVYPVGKKDGVTSAKLDHIPGFMADTARTGAGFFAIPQAFNWGIFSAKNAEEYRQYRDPAENEIFADALSFAIRGANDFWFYTCPFRPDSIRKSKAFGDPEYPERMFRNTAAAVTRLSKLEPYLVSETEPQWLPVKNGGSGKVLARSFADASGGTAILIVGHGEVDAEIEVPLGKLFRSEYGKAEKKEDGKYRFVTSYFGADVLYETQK